MKSFFTIFILTVLFLASTFTTSFSQTDWTKHEGNPVLIGTETWESGAVYFPFVIKDEGLYKMWYNGWDYPYTRVGYATSLDGINWTKVDSINPVLNVGVNGSWDDRAVFEPTILFDGSMYKMFYGGWDGTEMTTAPNLANVRWGYATSLDGINWTKADSINPVFGIGVSGSWDDVGHYGGDFLLIDSLYHCWYGGLDGTNGRIGHATSPNGISWNRDENNPVLNIGVLGEWDHLYVYEPRVHYNTDSARYEMFFEGGNSYGEGSIGFATSPDGIDWTKSIHNPVLSPGPEEWDNWAIGTHCIIRDGDFYKMWYYGLTNGSLNDKIGYATAPVDTPNVSIIGKDYSTLLQGYSLSQNYPNPFNPATKIKFTLPKPEAVKIEVYNLIGQNIKTLLNKPMPTGNHEVEFDAQNLSSGIYYYKIEAGEFQDVKKMILLK